MTKIQSQIPEPVLSIGMEMLQAGTVFAAIIYFLLRPFSFLAEPAKEKRLDADLYVMF